MSIDRIDSGRVQFFGVEQTVYITPGLVLRADNCVTEKLGVAFEERNTHSDIKKSEYNTISKRVSEYQMTSRQLLQVIIFQKFNNFCFLGANCGLLQIWPSFSRTCAILFFSSQF